MTPPDDTHKNGPKAKPASIWSADMLIALGSAGALVTGAVAVFLYAQTPADVSTQTTAPRPLAATLTAADDLYDAPYLTTQTATLKRGETLVNVTKRIGVEHSEGQAALNAAYEAGLADPRRLRPGYSVTAHMDGDRLAALTLSDDPAQRTLVRRTDKGEWQAVSMATRLIPAHIRVAGTIDTSLYQDARKLGAKDQQIVDFARIFAYDIDFQREIHPGDAYEIVFEAFTDERGTPVKRGEVLYAALNGKALTRGFYRFTPSDDPVTDYYDQHGKSATRFLMKTPINGARLSSHFGKRRHPISGYTRLHKGTDFAAPTGTPVYAAGHGLVERASRYGGYGKYVRIRHANGYETAYAHLSRYGTKKGARVRQGDIIGYVGSTGASTGPHLHYEVLRGGKHVNAMRLNFPTGRKLADTPEIYADFANHRAMIDTLRSEKGADIAASTASAAVMRPQ